MTTRDDLHTFTCPLSDAESSRQMVRAGGGILRRCTPTMYVDKDGAKSKGVSITYELPRLRLS